LIQLGCSPPPALIQYVVCGDKQAVGKFGVLEEVEDVLTMQCNTSNSTITERNGNVFIQKEDWFFAFISQ
jgi:hypothetical protein